MGSAWTIDHRPRPVVAVAVAVASRSSSSSSMRHWRTAGTSRFTGKLRQCTKASVKLLLHILVQRHAGRSEGHFSSARRPVHTQRRDVHAGQRHRWHARESAA